MIKKIVVAYDLLNKWQHRTKAYYAEEQFPIVDAQALPVFVFLMLSPHGPTHSVLSNVNIIPIMHAPSVL